MHVLCQEDTALNKELYSSGFLIRGTHDNLAHNFHLPSEHMSVHIVCSLLSTPRVHAVVFHWSGCACRVNMVMNECALVRVCMSALPQACCNAGPQMRWLSG